MSDKFPKGEQMIEAALFSADEPLSVDKLAHLFDGHVCPTNAEIQQWLKHLKEFYQDRGVELVEVASGYRFQAKADHADFLKRLWEKKPPRYSRALMETLALIAYRQPITRGEIEEVRCISVSSNMVRTLLERNWIKIAGYRNVPGKPAMFATTKAFLDYFNLKQISDLPPLSELVDFEDLEKQLGLQLPPQTQTTETEAEAEAEVEVEVETETIAEGEAIVTEDMVATKDPSHHEHDRSEI